MTGLMTCIRRRSREFGDAPLEMRRGICHVARVDAVCRLASRAHAVHFYISVHFLSALGGVRMHMGVAAG